MLQVAQCDPEQLVETAESEERSLAIESQRLLAQGEVFQENVMSGTTNTDQPAGRMTQQREHAGIIAVLSASRHASSHSFSVCELDPNPQISRGHVREELYLVVIESSFMPLHKEDRLRLRYLDKRAFVLVLASDV